MFIDEIKIHLKAGDGGDGVVRFRHEKFIDRGGPSGGNGGRGGDVYFEGIKDIGGLASFKQIKELNAEKGENGMDRSKRGGTGKDLIIKVPVGSFIKNLKTDFTYDILEEGERIKVLEGGAGGKGNENFKGPHNTTPREFTEGVSGDEADFLIELRLFADAGLVGFPNAGKSSLLNTLTKAGAKIGDYPFTTLEPNLGSFYGNIIADIPGLIEGASLGKGLGFKFLRHIQRTKIIIHCISSESKDVENDYKVIRRELEKYSEELAKKPEIIVLTKTDLLDEKTLKANEKKLKKFKREVFRLSILDDASIKNFSDNLTIYFNKLKLNNK